MRIKKITTLPIQLTLLVSPLLGKDYHGTAYSGTVYDKLTGRTIQAVSITDNRETSGTFSDHNGSFSISRLHRRSRELIFSAANYRNSAVELDTISGSLSVEMVRLSSEERNSSQLYIGKLLDDEIKMPLPNVTISFNQFTLNSDRDGLFSITAPRSGSQQVGFRSERYRDSFITLHFSDSTHTVTVHELEPKISLSSLVGSFSGVVIDENGIDVDRATVEILRSDRLSIVDKRGDLTIDSLYPGRYTAMVTSENYAPKFLNFELGNNEIVEKSVILSSIEQVKTEELMAQFFVSTQWIFRSPPIV